MIGQTPPALSYYIPSPFSGRIFPAGGDMLKNWLPPSTMHFFGFFSFSVHHIVDRKRSFGRGLLFIDDEG